MFEPGANLLFCLLKGRGTVATGRVEQGVVKVGDDVEVLGLMQVNFYLYVLSFLTFLPCFFNDILVFFFLFFFLKNFQYETFSLDFVTIVHLELLVILILLIQGNLKSTVTGVEMFKKSLDFGQVSRLNFFSPLSSSCIICLIYLLSFWPVGFNRQVTTLVFFYVV